MKTNTHDNFVKELGRNTEGIWGIKEGFTKELTFELGLEELNFDKGRKETFKTNRNLQD